MPKEILDIIMPCGTRLSGVLSMPAGQSEIDTPVVLCCHGFMSNKERSTYMDLATGLEKKGIACYRFDMRGHGESEGDISDLTLSTSIEAMQLAYELLAQQ